jgi:hypothetical protein
METLPGRKVLLRKVTGDALAAVHASPDVVFDLKTKGREVMRRRERGQNRYDPSAILWGYIYSRSGSLTNIFKFMESGRPSRISRKPRMA